MTLSNCHGNCHVSVHDSVLLGASGCDELTTSRGVKPKHKPRIDTGLCDAMHYDASKRVSRFDAEYRFPESIRDAT